MGLDNSVLFENKSSSNSVYIAIFPSFMGPKEGGHTIERNKSWRWVPTDQNASWNFTFYTQETNGTALNGGGVTNKNIKKGNIVVTLEDNGSDKYKVTVKEEKDTSIRVSNSSAGTNLYVALWDGLIKSAGPVLVHAGKHHDFKKEDLGSNINQTYNVAFYLDDTLRPNKLIGQAQKASYKKEITMVNNVSGNTISIKSFE